MQLKPKKGLLLYLFYNIFPEFMLLYISRYVIYMIYFRDAPSMRFEIAMTCVRGCTKKKQNPAKPQDLVSFCYCHFYVY